MESVVLGGSARKKTVKSLRASVAAKEPCRAHDNEAVSRTSQALHGRCTPHPNLENVMERVKAQVREGRNTYYAFPSQWMKMQMLNKGVSKSMLQKGFDSMEGRECVILTK